eukprot:7809605-Pyramimonas_sp.AAC.1
MEKRGLVPHLGFLRSTPRLYAPGLSLLSSEEPGPGSVRAARGRPSPPVATLSLAPIFGLCEARISKI